MKYSLLYSVNYPIKSIHVNRNKDLLRRSKKLSRILIIPAYICNHDFCFLTNVSHYNYNIVLKKL
jgi:hypothetical protein